MATIENISSELTHTLRRSVCAFTDDDRLMFIVKTEEACLCIYVYDILYNIFRKLSTRLSLTEYFNESAKNFQSNRHPGLLVIDDQTLVVSYDPECFYGPRENCSYILLVSIDFQTETFSIIQQLEYTDLRRSLLIKDGSDAVLLYDAGEMYDELYICSPLKLNSTQLVQTRSDPIKLLIERNHGYGAPTHERLHNNKVWCIVSAWDRSCHHQLMYFDLNDEHSKAVTVKFFEESLNLFHVQCLKSHMMFFKNEGEKDLTFFNLDSQQWSTVENNAVLKKYDYVHGEEPVMFCDGSDHFVDHFHFDDNLNIMMIDKVAMKMYRIPFGKPRKLAELAQTSVVNSRLLDQKRLQKLFQNKRIYLK